MGLLGALDDPGTVLGAGCGLNLHAVHTKEVE